MAENPDIPWDKINTHKPSTMMIRLDDGTLIKGKNGIETFMMFIEEMGWQAVRDLNFAYDEDNIITQTCRSDRYREITPGWYLYCGYVGLTRKKLIYAIAKALGRKITVTFNK